MRTHSDIGSVDLKLRNYWGGGEVRGGGVSLQMTTDDNGGLKSTKNLMT